MADNKMRDEPSTAPRRVPLHFAIYDDGRVAIFPAALAWLTKYRLLPPRE